MLFILANSDFADILFYSLNKNCIIEDLVNNKPLTLYTYSLADYDEDSIVLPQKYDAIITSLSLHYSNDIIGSLIQYRKYLKGNAAFLSVILGGETLKELKRCLSEIDEQKFGKIYPRVMPMIHPQVVPSLFQRAKYKNTVISVEKVELYYDSLKILFNDLKVLGQLNYLKNRSKEYVGKNYFLEVENCYFKRYQKNNKIIATFEFITAFTSFK